MSEYVKLIGIPYFGLRDLGVDYLKHDGEESKEQNFERVARSIAQHMGNRDTAIIFSFVLDNLTTAIDTWHRRGNLMEEDRQEKSRQLDVLETIMAKYSVGFAGTVMTRADVKTGVGFKRDVSEHLRA